MAKYLVLVLLLAALVFLAVADHVPGHVGPSHDKALPNAGDGNEAHGHAAPAKSGDGHSHDHHH